MVSEVIETPVDQVQAESQTETPPETPIVPEEGAAEAKPEAATQLEITEPEKPDYITRAEWEKERQEVAQKAAAEALETERRRRQTENARKAKQEQLDREEQQDAADTIRAALGAKGIFEDPGDAALNAITRIARKQAERLTQGSYDLVERTLDYIVAPAYGQKGDWDEDFAPLFERLAPKLQHLVNTISPTITTKAREDYIHKDELSKHVDAEIARRKAKERQESGEDNIQRVEGQPARDNSREARLDRINVGQETPDDAKWFQETYLKGR